jgi:hypothetical protein
MWYIDGGQVSDTKAEISMADEVASTVKDFVRKKAYLNRGDDPVSKRGL